jgi:tripartite-type tricarboxylate transporter receptor subunit TctC
MRNMLRALFNTGCGLAFFALVCMDANLPASAQSPDEFFRGKTARIIIGFETAGTYGQYAMLASRHLRKHMAGNPSIIVQSMPGASGISAIRHVAHVAPKDGTTLMLAPINIVQDGLLNASPGYDPTEFAWIGRMMELVQIGVASEKSGLRSLDDAKARTFNAAGIGVTQPTSLNWHLINALLGTKINVVSGYKGLPDAQLAWERGEADVVMMNWETAIQRFGDDIKLGKVRPLFSYTARPIEELKGLPAIGMMGNTPVEKAFLQVFTSGPWIGRSLAVHASVPKDRVEAWRAAFDAMLKDPEFLAEIEKGAMRFDPLSGAQVDTFIKQAATYPRDVLEGVRAYYEQVTAEKR